MQYTVQEYIRVRTIPNRPKSYFKYMTAKVAKIILVTHKLRWSSPLLFNDPFDVQRDFDFGFDAEELREPLINEFRRLVSAEDIPDLSRKPRVAYMVNLLRRQDYAGIRNTILQVLPQLIDEGIQDARRSYEQIKNRWSEFISNFRIF